MKTMEIPKITAFKIALPLFSDPREKKATVIGIIGKTHGVSTPAKPASSEIRKKDRNPRFTSAGTISFTGLSLLCDSDTFPIEGSEILNSNSTSFGGEQVALLHAI